MEKIKSSIGGLYTHKQVNEIVSLYDILKHRFDKLFKISLGEIPEESVSPNMTLADLELAKKIGLDKIIPHGRDLCSKVEGLLYSTFPALYEK